MVTYDAPGLVAYYSIVRTGSRNEVEPGKSGFAHFFEHMMFRGTPSYPTEKYNAVIKAMGADSNAFTSDDMTVYHILAGTAALPTIVEIEADRFQNLHYAEAEFQKEARAVLGEYNKSASNPMQPMVEALYDHAFTTHTYKHTTIGFLRDIEDMPNQLAYSRQFFDRYYRPDNVILLVVGDVTADQVLPLVEQHYGGWRTGPARPAVPAEPPQTGEKRATVPWKARRHAHAARRLSRARVLADQRRQRGPRGAGRAGVRRAGAALPPPGARRAEGRAPRRRRANATWTPTSSPSWRGSSRPRTCPTSRTPIVPGDRPRRARGHRRQDPGRGRVAHALRIRAASCPPPTTSPWSAPNSWP